MNDEIGIGFIIGVFIIGFVIGGVFAFGIGYNTETKKLGQAICEEEYGMDFRVYQGGVLKCKPSKPSKLYNEYQYNGIIIEIE